MQATHHYILKLKDEGLKKKKIIKKCKIHNRLYKHNATNQKCPKPRPEGRLEWRHD